MAVNFQEAIDYLTALTKFGINLGLQRIERLLDMVGNPHQKLKTIHIGGTNGKGSTGAMVSSILTAQGYKTGLYTSPHIHSYTERIKIDNQDISERDMAELIARLKPFFNYMVAEGYEHPTEFEVLTALGLLYFFEQGVELAVLEVGLGGAIDSTNIVHPLVAVITNVGMDHMEYLGHTIVEIARIKAGIIKPGVPVITAEEKKDVLDIIEETCRTQAAELFRLGRDAVTETVASSVEGQRFNYYGIYRDYRDLYVPLLGPHQVTNAGTALLTLEVLSRAGVEVTEPAVRAGLARTRWPARLEVLGLNPALVLDVAHNVDGAQALACSIKQLFPGQKIILIIAMLADKEREKVMSILGPLARKVVVTKPLSPRAGAWEFLAGEAKKYVSDVVVCEDISEAIEEGLRSVDITEVVLITGSFYMVSYARELLLTAYRLKK